MHLEKQQIGEEKHSEDTVSNLELKEDSHTANKNDPLIINKVEDSSLIINKTKDKSEKT